MITNISNIYYFVLINVINIINSRVRIIVSYFIFKILLLTKTIKEIKEILYNII